MNRDSEWYLQWKEKYYNKPIVNLNKYFSNENLEQLNKLGIEIQDKLYTEYEFELIDNQAIMYYSDDDIIANKLKYCKDLKSTGVTKEQLKKLLEKISNINIKYF